MCVCSNTFSETTGPYEAKFHVEPPWDRGRKFIQMVQAGPRSFVDLHYCQPPGEWGEGGAGGGGSRDFTINLSPQCRAFRGL